MANTLIHESRRLLLPFDTVVDALIELEIKHGRWPSNATLVEVAMHDSQGESGRSIVLSIRPPSHEAIVRRTYTLPIIAAAILNYCLTMRVPMPRSSTKTIQILPEGIVLQLENTLMLQRRHEEAPGVTIVRPDPVEPQAQEAAAVAESGAEGEAPEPAPGPEATREPEPLSAPAPAAPRS